MDKTKNKVVFNCNEKNTQIQAIPKLFKYYREF